MLALRPAAQVERPEPQEEPAERRVHHAVQLLLKVHHRRLGAARREIPAHDDARQRHAERLPHAVVAEIRHEKALRLARPSLRLRADHLLAHVLHASRKRTLRLRRDDRVLCADEQLLVIGAQRLHERKSLHLAVRPELAEVQRVFGERLLGEGTELVVAVAREDVDEFLQRPHRRDAVREVQEIGAASEHQSFP